MSEVMPGAAGGVLWLLVLLPAVVGGALTLARGAVRSAVAASLLTAAATLALSLLAALGRSEASVPFVAGADLTLRVDALAALVLPTVTTVTLLVLVFSTMQIREAPARFHGLMLLFLSAVVVTVTAATLPALLLGWEVMGAVSYALIGFWWREQMRVSAGLTAFVTTRAADLGLYLAAAAALAGGAGLALGDLPAATGGWRDVVAAGFVVAAFGKAAQLPFSFWLSRAMEGPSPVSALLHSAAMVAMGGYLLLRVEPLLAVTGWAGPLTTWVGALTAVLLGVVAVAQRDIKQLLAASTAAQLAFVVMAAGLGAVAGGAAHLVAHAATKALLFLAAGAWLAALGTKAMDGLLGVARRWRVLAVTATVGALALAGVAPLSLWATKDTVLAAAREESGWLYAVGLLASALSAAYAARIVVVIWGFVPSGQGARAESHYDEERPGTRSVSPTQLAPLVVLAAGAAVLGVLALPPVGTTLARALGGSTAVEPTAPELTVSAVLALVVVGSVARWRPPQPSWALAWLGLERAAHAAVVRPTLRLAEGLARFDDGVVDGAVNRAASAALHGAARTSRADDEAVDGAVERFAAAVRAGARLARRPQTGALHQYYLQAVALLAVGILLVVIGR